MAVSTGSFKHMPHPLPNERTFGSKIVLPCEMMPEEPFGEFICAPIQIVLLPLFTLQAFGGLAVAPLTSNRTERETGATAAAIYVHESHLD